MDSNFIKPLDSFVDEVIGYLPDYLRKDNLVKFMTVFLDRLEKVERELKLQKVYQVFSLIPVGNYIKVIIIV